MSFVDDFLQGLQHGQALKAQKQSLEWNNRRMQYEAEDRDVEKQLLQHRLKELKLTERLNARKLAQENLAALSGQSVGDLPSSQVEEASATPTQTGIGSMAEMLARGTPGFRPKLQTLPGVSGDLLGGVDIPDIQVRPETKESQLADLLAQNQIKALTQFHSIGAGGLANGLGEKVIEGNTPRVPLVKIRTRDARGKLVERNVPADSPEALQPQELEPLPKTNLTLQLPNSDFEDLIAGYKAGTTPLDSIPKTTQGLRIQSRLAKDGFDVNKGLQELAAARKFYSTLNGEQVTNLKIKAGALNGALDDLEAAQKAWGAGGYGVLSRARIAASKIGGGKGKQAALDFEQAVANVQQALADLRVSGGVPGQAQLDAAAQALSTGDNITAAIARLRKAAQYKVTAIGNLQPVIPATQGAADFTWDPNTQQLIPAR